MSLTEEVSFGNDGSIEPRGFRGLWKKLFLAMVIILVAFLAFGIGRLTAPSRSNDIKVEYDPELLSLLNGGEEASKTASALNSFEKIAEKSGEVVASSKGSKYHFPHCSGAKQISEKNKIVFASSAAAEASGYSLASNCKPR